MRPWRCGTIDLHLPGSLPETTRFGLFGAAGQHICEIADLLKIETYRRSTRSWFAQRPRHGMAQLQYTASSGVQKNK